MIRDMIRGGELAYGDPIPSQRQIEDGCRVAKATCGKALRALVDGGDVVVVPGIGAMVARKARR